MRDSGANSRGERLTFGGYIWENYDLTDRRRASYATALTETDFGLNLGYAAWTSDDENYALAFEFGHDWMTYHNRVGRTDANSRVQRFASIRGMR